MTEREDTSGCIGRRRAIGVDVQHLAAQRVSILRHRRRRGVSGSDVQGAVGVGQDAAAAVATTVGDGDVVDECAGARQLGPCGVDGPRHHGDMVVGAPARTTGARTAGTCSLTLHALAGVDGSGCGEVRRQCDAHQACLARRVEIAEIRFELAGGTADVTNDESPRSLAGQHRPVGGNHGIPRFREPVEHGGDRQVGQWIGLCRRARRACQRQEDAGGEYSGTGHQLVHPHS